MKRTGWAGGLAALLLGSILGSCTAGGPTQKVLAAARARSAAVYHAGVPVPAGSGLVLPGGRILTCLHVVPRSRRENRTDRALTVEIGGVRRTLRAIRFESRFDLALLEIEGGGVPPSEAFVWAARETLSEGEDVFLYGAPFGLAASFLEGKLSHTGRRDTDPGFPEIPFVQVQGLAYPGTSGAAVYRRDGSVIGILRSAYGGNETGIGLVIPAGFVRTFLGETP